MKTSFRKQLIFAAVSLVLSSGVLAAGNDTPEASALDRREPDKTMDYTRPVVSGALLNRQVGQLKGMDLYNMKGEEIGEVNKVVLDSKTNKLYAVISVGGLFGIGDTLTPIALDRVDYRDDKLYIATSMNEYDPKNAKPYNDAKYLDLEDDQLLSDLDIRSDNFALLDENMDGAITKDEALKYNEPMVKDWENLDTDGDHRLSRSEFSAFEQMEDNKPTEHQEQKDRAY